MYANHTYKYIDALDSITEAYNNSYHSSIKMSSSDVNESNQSALWQQLYLPKPANDRSKIKDTPKNFKFEIGDFERISFLRKAFSREYDQKWSDEIFRVARRYKPEGIPEGIPVYKLKDFNSTEDIQGTFYQQEIQKVDVPVDKLYKIDKILGTKINRFILVFFILRSQKDGFHSLIKLLSYHTLSYTFLTKVCYISYSWFCDELFSMAQ